MAQSVTMAQLPTEFSEGELMRVCGPLYPALAIESLSSLLLFGFFAYMVLMVKTQQRLQTPGKAVIKMILSTLYGFLGDFWAIARTWAEMPTRPLKERFAFCRKMNEMICMLSAVIALISVTRWLHIGNVNGFRYLGYAVTCPVMQAELVILIAPVVPCFRFNAILASTITCVSLLAGYVASTMSGPIYLGSLEDLSYQDAMLGDFSDIRPTGKFWWTMSSMLGMVFLIVAQMPLLCLLYTCRGGVNRGLPWGFRRLLSIVTVTWIGFPVWWLMSYEGMNIVTDTKLNGLGFAALNIISKGSFSWQVLLMVGWHRRQDKENSKIAKAATAMHSILGRQFSPDSCASSQLESGVSSTSSAEKTGLFSLLRRRPSFCSDQEAEVHLNAAAEEDPWYVTLLMPYDSGAKSQIDSTALATKPNVLGALPPYPCSPAAASYLTLDKNYASFLAQSGISPNYFEELNAEERVRILILYKSMPLAPPDGIDELRCQKATDCVADADAPSLKSFSGFSDRSQVFKASDHSECVSSSSIEPLVPAKKWQVDLPLRKQPKTYSGTSSVSTACPSSLSRNIFCEHGTSAVSEKSSENSEDEQSPCAKSKSWVSRDL